MCFDGYKPIRTSFAKLVLGIIRFDVDFEIFNIYISARF
jgi:hypothetical protein